MDQQLHQVQMGILKFLLLNHSAGFTQIAKPLGITTKHFNYHLSCLLKSGYVIKELNNYQLTIKGKEFANRMDTEKQILEKQAKLDCMMIIEKEVSGVKQLLIQKRCKEPYYGYLGFLTGKISWGEQILETAARELLEETGLCAQLEIRCIFHEQVYLREDKRLLEDKFFFIIKGVNPKGELINLPSGENYWMTKTQLKKQSKVYYDEFELLDICDQGGQKFYEKKFYVDEF
jgi:predicted transcriptional regulator